MGASLNLFSIKQTTEKNRLESVLCSLLSGGVKMEEGGWVVRKHVGEESGSGWGCWAGQAQERAGPFHFLFHLELWWRVISPCLPAALLTKPAVLTSVWAQNQIPPDAIRNGTQWLEGSWLPGTEDLPLCGLWPAAPCVASVSSVVTVGGLYPIGSLD